MTNDEALQSLIDSCKEFSDAAEKLKAENVFLVDTIEKNNLGEIARERRMLIAKAKEAEKIKDEYEKGVKEYEIRLADITAKQNKLDFYINDKAEEKIASLRADCARKVKEFDRESKKEIARMQEKLNVETQIFRRQKKIYVITAFAGIAAGILGVVSRFL